MPKALTGLSGELGFKRRDNPAAWQREWAKRNRERLREYHREYHHKKKHDPAYKAMKVEASKVSRRKKKYNITREQYAKLLTEQKGNCMICFEYYGEELRVDHDHSTGEVRALLCANCNAGLGMFRDDPMRLTEALRYLETHQN